MVPTELGTTGLDAGDDQRDQADPSTQVTVSHGVELSDRHHQDDVGQEKVRWNFFQSWPSKWTGPSLNATGNEVAIDELTVSCERLERA